MVRSMSEDLAFNQPPSLYALGVFYWVCDAIDLPREAVALFSNTTSRACAITLGDPLIDGQGRIYPAGYRMILYNPTHFSNLEKMLGTPWVAIQVMAHEVGHHYAKIYNHHQLKTAWDHEQAADYHAGRVMARLGAGIEDVMHYSQFHSKRPGSPTHPPSENSDHAIVRGWEDGQGQSNPRKTEPQLFDPARRWWP